MLTISARKALTGMNGAVAKVGRVTPRIHGCAAPPPRDSSPRNIGAISKESLLIRAWLWWSAMHETRGAVVYGVILGALLWIPVGAWLYSEFVTP